MRRAFKNVAEENTMVLYQNLEEFLEGTWALARKSSNVIDGFRAEISFEGKELDSTLMLRNTISDLCCCLDALERGGDRTILNNLKMAFEDYCCCVQLHWDPKAYEKFIQEKLDVPGAIPFVKKLRKNEDFGRMYGLLTKISHHSQLALLARQVVFIDKEKEKVCWSHLKPINPAKLISQVSNLVFIAFLLIEIGVLAEEICFRITDRPLYFGVKTLEGYEKKLDTSEAAFILKLAAKLDNILHPFQT